jgi:hypothetical protein
MIGHGHSKGYWPRSCHREGSEEGGAVRESAVDHRGGVRVACHHHQRVRAEHGQTDLHVCARHNMTPCQCHPSCSGGVPGSFTCVVTATYASTLNASPSSCVSAGNLETFMGDVTKEAIEESTRPDMMLIVAR